VVEARVNGGLVPRETLLARTLVELADTLVADFEAMRMLELFELQSREGPCLDCYRSGTPVLEVDLTATGTRWPNFSAEALAAGFRSVQALPMRLRGTVIGALNLFGTGPAEMQRVDIDSAQALADVATIAILQQRKSYQAQVLNQQLQHALNSRIVIEQAKGKVAERESLTMPAAFSALRGYARLHNLRLVDVARSVVDGSLGPSALRMSPEEGPGISQRPAPP
jgi:GAF domain-containing protein